jgi:hypothetical protein
MNPFEKIEEMKQILVSEIKTNNIKKTDTITQEEHYKRMINMLNILSEELKTAEYYYQAEKITGEIKTFDDFPVLQKSLNDNIIIFQPVVVGEFRQSDMHSLADVLKALKDDGQIKENIMVLPPDVEVLRAVLATSTEDEEETEEAKEE